MKPSIREIIEAVAVEFNVTPEQITGQRRHADLFKARAAVCQVAAEAGFSSPLIGKALRRDHSTVLNAITRAQGFMAEDRGFALTLAKVRKIIIAAPVYIHRKPTNEGFRSIRGVAA